MSKEDAEKKSLKFQVNIIEKDRFSRDVQLGDIICPICHEPCRITFKNYKIKLHECINRHIINDINITEFADNQIDNNSQIFCDICKLNNKNKYPMNEFFRCITCHKNICNLCKPRHEPKHNIIKYDQKNYICQLHNEKLIKYCKDCNTNICSVCDGHDEHKKVDFEDLIPNIEEKKNILNKMKTMIDSIDIRIKEIINILNEVSDFMKKFYHICNNIVSNYDEKRNNYQILQNLMEISTNNIIYNKLKEIDLNIKDNINDIFDLYNNIHIKEIENKIEDKKEIEKDNEIDEITIIYDSLNKSVIEIFSEDFVSSYKMNAI